LGAGLFILSYSAIQDLDEAMKKSTARWKIVVGHHTLRSVSDHGDTKELLELLLPVLKVIQR
jgi:tartrate-resistant acid phosphatase type 5